MSDPLWTDIGLFVTSVVGTAAAIGAARFLWSQIQSQGSQHREQLAAQAAQHREALETQERRFQVDMEAQEGRHRQQLQGQLRPLVDIAHFERYKEEGRTYACVWVRNVGPGPALNVKVSAWLRMVQAPDRDVQGWADREIAGLDITQPAEYTIRLGAMSTGCTPVPWLLTAFGTAAEITDPPVSLAILYTVAYQDVYDTSFPRVERGPHWAGHEPERQAGSYERLGLAAPPNAWFTASSRSE